ncbi:MAG: hypothetical protein AB1508_15965 [Pseudomonadota bacterium]
MRFYASAAFCAAMSFLAACDLPPLALNENRSVPIAPSGPPVAALIANIKCELWRAANDPEKVPYYNDFPELTPHRTKDHPDRDLSFSLAELFTEVEYVADFKLTLQVTDTGALNPSVNFIKNLPTAGSLLTLAVGGQLSGQADRFIDIYQSVDFSRLIDSPENDAYKAIRAYAKQQHIPFPKVSQVANETDAPCDQGALLAGQLGLKEALATYAITARMQDVAVLLSPSASPSGGASSGGTLYGQQVGLTGFNGYAFGQMDTQIDFTILADLNAGPNWTLARFKGPIVTSAGGANGAGLLNFSRQAKDTLLVTFLPVCIRPKYIPDSWAKYVEEGKLTAPRPAPKTPDSIIRGTLKNGQLDASVTAATKKKAPALPKLNYPLTYVPKPSYGTPVWANYLPPCLSPAGEAALGAAQGVARTNNQLQGIQNLLQ